MSDIVYNAMETPDGTVLESRHRHDYQTHTDQNGEEYMVDGGKAYLRRSVNKVPAKDLSLRLDDPHKDIREAVTWGTYGKDGKQPLRYVTIKEMTAEHILAVINTQRLAPFMYTILKYELEYRKTL